MTSIHRLTLLGACAALSACVAAPPPPPEPAYAAPAPRASVAPKIHHVRRKPAGGAPGEVASACPWPAHSKSSPAHLETPTTQVPMPAGASEDTVEGCAVLRFGVSPAGTVTYIDVVNAKPDTVAPVALKALLAARFRPSAHPDDEALVRVELRSPQPDQVVASMRVR